MILLTGASGFAGRQLLPALQAGGHTVRAALRTPAAADLDAETTVVGEIGPDTDWTRALAGVDAVVHLAGLAHVLDAPSGDDASTYFRVNTDGTAHLARAAAAAGVSRFVFASSVKVYGDATSGRLLRESDPTPAADPYGASKRRAEEALVAIHRETGMRTVSLRLPVVHGPGARANLLRLYQWVDRGVPLPLGAIRNRRSLLSVRNLAHAVGLALDAPDLRNEVFNVSDAEDVSTPDLIRRIAAALGRPARLIPVPVALLAAAARLAGRSADFERLAGDLAVDVTHIAERLRYRPTESLDQGLAAMARWYRARRADEHGVTRA